MRIKTLLSVLAALAVTFVATVTALPMAPASAADHQAANRIHTLINDYRAQHGLSPLAWNEGLAGVAGAWTEHSAAVANVQGAGSFMHNPNFMNEYPAGALSYSENIAWSMSADQSFQWWAGSAPHRANMLRGADTDIGIAVVQLTSGPNKGAYLATANFGQYEGTAARIEAERKAAEEAARVEAERKAAAEEAARVEAERKAAEEAARVEAERKAAEEAARIEAERTETADQSAADKAAAEEAVRVEAERKAAEEAARVEAERKAAAEEAARVEAERKAAEEAARVEAEQKAAEEAARVEAEQKAAEEAAGIQTASVPAGPEANPAPEGAPATTPPTDASEENADEADPAANDEQDAPAQDPASADVDGAASTARTPGIPVMLESSDPAALTPATKGDFRADSRGSGLALAGLTPGATYQVFLHSTPINMGLVAADDQGALSLAVPAELPAGEHKVALYLEGELVGWQPFTVEAAVDVMAASAVAGSGPATLANTGLTRAQLMVGGLGALLMAGGMGILLILRHQKRAGDVA